MARGKAAAQNANRRAADAVARAEQLAAQLAAERATHLETTRSLETELRNLRNTVGDAAARKAADLSAARVAEAEGVAAKAAAAAHDAAKTSITELFAAFYDGSFDIYTIVPIAQRLGVEPHEVVWDITQSESSRYARRLTWPEYIKNNRRGDADILKKLQRGVSHGYLEKEMLRRFRDVSKTVEEVADGEG